MHKKETKTRLRIGTETFYKHHLSNQINNKFSRNDQIYIYV